MPLDGSQTISAVTYVDSAFEELKDKTYSLFSIEGTYGEYTYCYGTIALNLELYGGAIVFNYKSYSKYTLNLYRYGTLGNVITWARWRE